MIMRTIFLLVFRFLTSISMVWSLPITKEIWSNWEYLSLPEQLNYLLDDSELLAFKEEHAALGPAGLVDVLWAHAEFQDPSKSTIFFNACDTDQNGHISFQELCICRGDFDRFGSPHVMSEWHARADAMLEEFELSYMSNPSKFEEEIDADIAEPTQGEIILQHEEFISQDESEIQQLKSEL
jgi:hypothetical protein